jgi:hypothetical protein
MNRPFIALLKHLSSCKIHALIYLAASSFGGMVFNRKLIVLSYKKVHKTAQLSLKNVTQYFL